MLKPGLFLTISATLLCPILFFVHGTALVDINTASLAQLDTLMGIGPALGQRIIDNRPYNSIDDLLKIQGIGPKNLEKIKQQGLACVNCQGLAISTSTENSTTQQESVSKLADRHSLIQNEGSSTIGHATEEVVRPNPLPVNYPDNIFINEILPSPEGPDTENEFIEIFNANNFKTDISGFKIKDRVGAIKTFTIPAGTRMKENEFLIFKSNQTKISLNNTGDSVELLDPAGKIIDSVDFGKSKQGQSWSKNNGGWPAQSPADNEAGWQWTAKPTPNQANALISTQTTSTFHSPEQASSSPLTANIQNFSPQRKNFLAVGVAVAIALSSALVAWKIKKKSIEI